MKPELAYYVFVPLLAFAVLGWAGVWVKDKLNEKLNKYGIYIGGKKEIENGKIDEGN